MKAQVLTDIRKMSPMETPTPTIQNPKDVLLKIEFVGICGSDVHYFETGRIGSQVVQYPYSVGHECSATVVDFGSAVKTLQKGEPVVVDPAMACHTCDQCRAGREHTCRNNRFLGCPGQAAGCLSEYLVMPERCCFPIRNKLTLQQGVLCEPFAIGVYGVEMSAIDKGRTAAIFGAGPIGLSCLKAAQVRGAGRIYMTEIVPDRINLAQKHAFWVGNPEREDVVKQISDMEPGGIDIAYECAGRQETIAQAVEVLKPGGKLILIGIPREEQIWLNPDLIRRKEISIHNVRRQNGCTQMAIDMMADGKADLDFMITHVFDFADSEKAFKLVAGYEDGVIKALIKI